MTLTFKENRFFQNYLLHIINHLNGLESLDYFYKYFNRAFQIARKKKRKLRRLKKYIALLLVLKIKNKSSKYLPYFNRAFNSECFTIIIEVKEPYFIKIIPVFNGCKV